MKATVFSFRVDEQERKLIAALSQRLQRNQSDVVRLIIREAAEALGLQNKQTSSASIVACE